MDDKLLLPPKNQYSSRKKWEDACWQKILKSGKTLDILVTVNERHNLIMRAAVIDYTHSRKTFKQIVEELQLSPQTVSSIKKTIKESGYKSYRERGKTERKRKSYGNHQLNKKPYRRYRRTKYGKIYTSF